MRSVVSIPKQAAEEAQENPRVAELKERLIKAYPRLFSGVANKNPPDRGRFGTAKIKLKPNPKIYRHREYQLQDDRAEAMKKLLAEFIERGWIEPSDSEWASPAFIVPKKEKGEWRLVVDYRGLNEQTEHDSYSLPLIDSILQKQQKKRIFTVLDLKHGYHQMPLHPDSRPCTAMSTPLGPMQWKVVPMGAKNGNAAFQRMMEDLLGPVRDCADPFVDDIIIGSGTENMTEDELIDAHEKDLRRVLSELDKHNMVCKPTKASLFVKEVEFAGHVVGHGQRRPMPGKLASLHHWEKPQTISELQSFMRFCNYYSGYVRMYAELSEPLHKMLQVGKFDGRKGSKKKLAWTPEAEDAFSRLKERLMGQLGLFLVDPDKGFVLRTDASDYAVGAVLEQVRDDETHVPVAFWSRILAEGQRRTWTAREKETYAIVCAVDVLIGSTGNVAAALVRMKLGLHGIGTDPGLLADRPAAIRSIRATLDIVRDPGWKPLLLTTHQVSSYNGLVEVSDYIASLSNHTHPIVPILIEENIYQRCLKLLYCNRTRRWNWHKKLKKTPVLYGCWLPFKYLVTNVWRRFHSLFVYFRFGRLGVGKTVGSYPKLRVMERPIAGIHKCAPHFLQQLWQKLNRLQTVADYGGTAMDRLKSAVCKAMVNPLQSWCPLVLYCGFLVRQ